MTIRSWLFIPGDSDKKLAKGDSSPADALILDLEDAVAAEAKAPARAKVRAYLDARPPASRRAQLWVRVNPLDSVALDDLAAVTGGAPDGIILPKGEGARDVVRLGHYLDALEAREGIEAGRTGIMPVATETAAAVFALAEFAGARLPRLVGLTWGAEDLPAAIGASTSRDPDGSFGFTYRWVRSQMLLAAKAAGVQAVETLHADFRDATGLEATSRAAASEGFTGRLAIHPDQVAVINAAFAPSESEVAHARRVLAAFDAAGGAGTVGLDGKMLDLPHLKQARHILSRAGL